MKTSFKQAPLRAALHTLAIAATATLLVACGSDDDEPQDGTAVTLEVPTSATVSVAAWTQFAASLPASESADPLAMNAAEPPTSETAEPQAL